ncbi:DUF2218 domain-containing protein [Nioella aestuarii]|uniref:DUF2218 domain-containing protein n=1 Tax=Nioella aestuarii TaxID=1662864 RepID=UPI003D7FE64C
MNATATFATDRASRYLKALCHHFGRKVEAQCDETSGRVKFPFGRCDLAADADQLTLQVSADDPRRLDQLAQIITRHLERFAFRENPELDWSRTPTEPQNG